MKTFLTLAALAAFVAAPAMAGDDMTPEQKQAKVDWMFSKEDTDSNGLISKAEFTTFMDSKFTAADTNADGSISKEEKMAAWDKEKAEWDANKPK